MLSKKLKELRTQQKKTQKQVAEYLNITREAYTQYETGARKPDYETIQKLADFFNVSLDVLHGREIKPDVPEKREIKLSEKEMKDIKRKAESIKAGMMASIGLAFDGKIDDEDTLEKVMAVLEETLILARIEAKEKYTPKKYRK